MSWASVDDDNVVKGIQDRFAVQIDNDRQADNGQEGSQRRQDAPVSTAEQKLAFICKEKQVIATSNTVTTTIIVDENQQELTLNKIHFVSVF